MVLNIGQMSGSVPFIAFIIIFIFEGFEMLDKGWFNENCPGKQ